MISGNQVFSVGLERSACQRGARTCSYYSHHLPWLRIVNYPKVLLPGQSGEVQSPEVYATFGPLRFLRCARVDSRCRQLVLGGFDAGVRERRRQPWLPWVFVVARAVIIDSGQGRKSSLASPHYLVPNSDRANRLADLQEREVREGQTDEAHSKGQNHEEQ